MKLSLCSSSENIRIEINTDSFKRLRDPAITSDEIHHIASECGVNALLLINYVEDLKRSVREAFEIDGSCDYSDHL